MSREEIEKEMYWSVMFDLSCAKLREIHPSHNDTTAYSELGYFFHKYGFIHRQGSVYSTTFKCTEVKIYDVLDRLYRTFPWIYPCSKDIRLAGFESVVKADIREHFRKMYDHDMETAGCDIDYINMHSDSYDPNKQNEEEFDMVKEAPKKNQTLKETLIEQALRRKKTIEQEQKKETSGWKLIL